MQKLANFRVRKATIVWGRESKEVCLKGGEAKSQLEKQKLFNSSNHHAHSAVIPQMGGKRRIRGPQLEG